MCEDAQKRGVFRQRNSRSDQGPLITDGWNTCKWTGPLVVLAKTFIIVKISGQKF